MQISKNFRLISGRRMKSLARSCVFKVKPYVPGRPIEEVQRKLGLKEVIKLASNESPFPPSRRVTCAIQKALPHLNRYPEGSCYDLRRELSRRLKVASNQLIFGNGSDEIIVMGVRAFVQEGDEVVVAKPSFLIYKMASVAAGARIQEVPLKNFRYDLEAIEKALTKKTKIIFIGNPDNPASTYVTHREAETFLRAVPPNVLVLLDEAYFEFVEEDDYPDSLALLKTHKNLLVTRTFSKMYGLAGLRIGYGISRPETIDILERVREPFNVNTLAQVAAVACLKDSAYYRAGLKLLKDLKQCLYENFRTMGLPFVESATNFILVRVPQDSSVVDRELLKRGVIIRDMSFWGLKNFIRVTVGTPAENQKFLRALKAVL